MTSIFTFIGGIGLFLLGMRLMTDGLRSAAGETLRDILGAATRSPGRGLASGVLITAMVQSSSAVIFATVGFVNAGLLTLQQAVGVIYGSNVGTTLTSWIVAVVGFNVDLRAMALPAIGIGMALWVALGSRRSAALGQAIAGFGLFFLGIDLLRDAFAGIGDAAALEAWAGQGIASLVLFTLIGMVLTVLMQSSSAALAVTLTAAAGGLIPLNAAAAMVIGANVGTTSTAAFASIGATAAARRAASAHVAFNVVTGTMALLLLPTLLWLVSATADLLGLAPEVPVLLAIFHTLTNLLGVVVMWPLTGLLVAQLERRFRSREEDESRPQHLDRTVQATPVLALGALLQELHRMNTIAARLAASAVSAEPDGTDELTAGRRIIDHLSLSVGEFASGIPRQEQDTLLANVLPDTLRVSQNRLLAAAAEIIAAGAVDAESWSAQHLTDLRAQFEADYQTFKRELLRAGTERTLSPQQMAVALEYNSDLHRVVDQAVKAATFLSRITVETKHPAAPAAPDSPAASQPEASAGPTTAPWSCRPQPPKPKPMPPHNAARRWFARSKRRWPTWHPSSASTACSPPSPTQCAARPGTSSCPRRCGHTPTRTGRCPSARARPSPSR
jgi:phosphate:Na+ symporter